MNTTSSLHCNYQLLAKKPLLIRSKCLENIPNLILEGEKSLAKEKKIGSLAYRSDIPKSQKRTYTIVFLHTKKKNEHTSLLTFFSRIFLGCFCDVYRLRLNLPVACPVGFFLSR